MFGWLKRKKRPEPEVAVTTTAEVATTKKKKLSPKEEATEKGEPWVSIPKIGLNLETMASGELELDWNQEFINQLLRAGYRGKDDEDLVEQWLRHLCRGILMELWEQEEANDKPARYTQQRDIGDGRTEVS